MSQSYLAPQPVVAFDDLAAWRSMLVRRGLRVMLIIGVLAVAAGSYYAITTGSDWVIPLYLLAYAGLLVVALRPKIGYTWQAGTLLALVYAVGVLDLVDSGRGGDGRVFLLAVPVLATLLFGRRAGWAALGVAAATLLAFAWLFTTQRLLIPVERQANYANPAAWISNTAVLVLMGGLLAAAQGFLIPRLNEALQRSHSLLDELGETQRQLREHAAGLELAQRKLAGRTQALQATSALARDAGASTGLGELLTRVAQLVSQSFDFYHTGLFMLSPDGEWAELRAASSPGGQVMLERGHRLQVGAVGIVGHVAGSGEPRLALDVGQDAVFFNNPHLPQTRSEMALPLISQGRVIGVLDVQSTQAGAFSDEDFSMLQAIADQAALMITNLHLLEQEQLGRERERRGFGQLSHTAWQALLRSRPPQAYRYHHGQVVVLPSKAETPPADAAATPAQNVLTVPISVRGYALGVVEVKKPEHQAAWSDPEKTLLNDLVDQLAVALESARLYQDTQRRAERERLAAEITNRMRQSNEPEKIMQIAAEQLRQALQAQRAQVLVRADLNQGPQESTP